MINPMFPQQILIQLPQHQMEIVVQVKIGSGTQGSVYQGFIKNLNQQVAIKVMNELNPREEKILQSIKQHKPKHIIRIYAVEKLWKQVYIVMELAEMDFFKFMNTNQFSTYDVDEKSEFFLQMVKGVQEFHQIGYFHRDLKPENFVCCRDKSQNLTIKLIDFGCSKEQSDGGKQTLQVGTPYYMARDVINSTNYTKEIDIWAMGAIWYEMITLQTFFQGITHLEIYNQQEYLQREQLSVINNFNQNLFYFVSYSTIRFLNEREIESFIVSMKEISITKSPQFRLIKQIKKLINLINAIVSQRFIYIISIYDIILF